MNNFRTLGIEETGRLFFVGRGLSIPIAEEMGVYSTSKEICFPFYRDGDLVRLKFRDLNDKKKQRFNSQDDKGFKMPFWNQLNTPTMKDLYITEGEFDCIALAQLGVSNCVSLPSGSGSVKSSFKDNYEFLQKFDNIYICFDMDKPGEDAAIVAMEMLPPQKFNRIVFPYKDANEWLLKETPTLEDFEKLKLNARRVQNKNFLNMADVDEHFYDQIDLGVNTGWPKLDSLIGGLRLGEVTVVSADTGAGKTTFCTNLMYNIAAKKHGVWINSYEVHPYTVIRKFASLIVRKQLKLQKIDDPTKESYLNWMRNHTCYINTFKDKTDLKTLKNQIEIVSLAYKAKYILLDHLDYIHSAGTKTTTLENIDDAMREIHTFAMDYQVCIILVVHPKQSPDPTKETTMSDLKGSSSIKQYADNIITLMRMDRADPSDPGKKGKVKLKVWKNRLLGKEGEVYLTYLPQYDSFTDGF